MILLVTRRDDLTADLLIERLLERGAAYLRFDVDHYLDDVYLDAEFSSQAIEGEVITPQGRCSLGKIKSIWYRRAMTPVAVNDIQLEYRGFARRESEHFLQAAFGSLDVKWVNPWGSTYKWERKLSQLRLAASLGLRVPRTFVGTSVEKMKRFLGNGKAVSKAISYGLLELGEEAMSIYTHDFDASGLLDEAAASACPTLLQERIEKVADIRLTVVGPKIFPARIDAALADGLDWRRPAVNATYTAINVPESVASVTVEMLRRMGLVYGAFDFGLLESGEWVFFEVNPTGEFAWIEDRLGFPIRDAIVDELVRL
jgi:glutathione synthase/RimK-type ligase-like ATP-grasp enzyme